MDTGAAIQQNWQSSEKSQHFEGKNTIFNENPVYFCHRILAKLRLVVCCLLLFRRNTVCEKNAKTTRGMCALLVFNMLKFACLLYPKTDDKSRVAILHLI